MSDKVIELEIPDCELIFSPIAAWKKIIKLPPNICIKCWKKTTQRKQQPGETNPYQEETEEFSPDIYFYYDKNDITQSYAYLDYPDNSYTYEDSVYEKYQYDLVLTPSNGKEFPLKISGRTQNHKVQKYSSYYEEKNKVGDKDRLTFKKNIDYFLILAPRTTKQRVIYKENNEWKQPTWKNYRAEEKNLNMTIEERFVETQGMALLFSFNNSIDYTYVFNPVNNEYDSTSEDVCSRKVTGGDLLLDMNFIHLRPFRALVNENTEPIWQDPNLIDEYIVELTAGISYIEDVHGFQDPIPKDITAEDVGIINLIKEYKNNIQTNAFQHRVTFEWMSNRELYFESSLPIDKYSVTLSVLNSEPLSVINNDLLKISNAQNICSSYINAVVTEESASYPLFYAELDTNLSDCIPPEDLSSVKERIDSDWTANGYDKNADYDRLLMHCNTLIINTREHSDVQLQSEYQLNARINTADLLCRSNMVIYPLVTPANKIIKVFGVLPQSIKNKWILQEQDPISPYVRTCFNEHAVFTVNSLSDENQLSTELRRLDCCTNAVLLYSGVSLARTGYIMPYNVRTNGKYQAADPAEILGAKYMNNIDAKNLYAIFRTAAGEAGVGKACQSLTKYNNAGVFVSDTKNGRGITYQGKTPLDFMLNYIARKNGINKLNAETAQKINNELIAFSKTVIDRNKRCFNDVIEGEIPNIYYKKLFKDKAFKGTTVVQPELLMTGVIDHMPWSSEYNPDATDSKSKLKMNIVANTIYKFMAEVIWPIVHNPENNIDNIYQDIKKQYSPSIFGHTIDNIFSSNDTIQRKRLFANFRDMMLYNPEISPFKCSDKISYSKNSKEDKLAIEALAEKYLAQAVNIQAQNLRDLIAKSKNPDSCYYEISENSLILHLMLWTVTGGARFQVLMKDKNSAKQ